MAGKVEGEGRVKGKMQDANKQLVNGEKKEETGEEGARWVASGNRGITFSDVSMKHTAAKRENMGVR